MKRLLISWSTILFLSCSFITACGEADNISEQAAATSSNNSDYFAIGQVIDMKDVSYTVLDSKEMKEYHGAKTQGKFVVVTIDAKNTSDKAESFDDSMFLLVDDQGKQYKSDSTRDISFTDDEYFSLANQVNPGMDKEGKVSFEIPADVTSYKLALRTDLFDFGGADYQFVKLK